MLAFTMLTDHVYVCMLAMFSVHIQTQYYWLTLVNYITNVRLHYTTKTDIKQPTIRHINTVALHMSDLTDVDHVIPLQQGVEA